MKKIKKTLALLCCAVLLVCISVGATIAYLTSGDVVTNTFTTGEVKITLDEAPVYAYGDENIDEGKEHGDAKEGTRVKANEYRLFPGHDYDKDPTVHVDKDSEDCWIFVKVDNGIAAIEDDVTYTVNGVDDTGKIADQIEAFGWNLIDEDNHIYAYKDIVKANDNIQVFANFKILGTVTDLAAYKDAKIVINAYAVQADGFDTAEEAWAAGNGEKNWVDTETPVDPQG